MQAPLREKLESCGEKEGAKDTVYGKTKEMEGFGNATKEVRKYL